MTARNGSSRNEVHKPVRPPQWKDFSESERLGLLEEAFYQMTRRPARFSSAKLRAARAEAKANRKGPPLDSADLERARQQMNKLTPRQRQRLHAQALALIYGESLLPNRG